MSLNNIRVGKDDKEFFQAVHMNGRLQHPSSRWPTQLQMLQKTSLPEIDGREVGSTKKGLVTRDATSRNKFIGHESVAVNRHTFMRRAGTDGANRVGLWRESAKPPKPRSSLTHAQIMALANRRDWKRKHNFPYSGAAIIRVLGQ